MSSIYDSLNPVQQEAVRHTEGPLLILAGAGSGKTRVLTHRIAYLIEECGVKPWNIFAITFTNKAAREMRERVDALLGSGAEDVWVSTFHSACVRILRRYIDRLGFERNFTIYDTDDQKSLVKAAVREMNLDSKLYRESAVLSVISNAKNQILSPEVYASRFAGDFYREKIGDIYKIYQEKLRNNNAMDFDDLLLRTVELFEKDKEVLEYYQNRFKYIMVDEYQDTNEVQFKLVSLLAEGHRNLCVVGDDDQSIYRFRGADIRNILGFEEVFPDARVIRLEENYRSTKKILSAANAVIKNNIFRKDKTLWTENDDGPGIAFRVFPSDYDEAQAVVRDITNIKSPALSYGDFAVLYRTNAQARMLEEKFVLSGIPYRVYGGVNFYQRKEIKDVLAYLRAVENGFDDVSVARIINVPRRGIGSTSLQRAMDYAAAWDLDLMEALRMAPEIEGLGRAASKMKVFAEMIDSLAEEKGLTELFDRLMDESGYRQMLLDEGSDEAAGRLENLDELRNKIVDYEESTDETTLSGLLEEIALVSDIDGLDEDEDRVVLMTLHSAKGLEFEYVYITGMEEGIFPGYMAITSDDPEGEVEEERRLCYVGITRAKRRLFMSCAQRRMIHGSYQYNPVSRFISEIPKELLDNRGERELYSGKFSGSGCGDKSEIRVRVSYDDQVRRSQNHGGSGAGKRNYDRGHGHGFKESPPDFGRGRGSGNIFGESKGPLLRKGSEIAGERPDYGVGDRVRHIKFGVGEVMEIKEISGDFQITVRFEDFGVKKMKAGFARLRKV